MTPEDESYYKTLMKEFDMTMKRFSYLDEAMKDCTNTLRAIDLDMRALVKKYKGLRDGVRKV